MMAIAGNSTKQFLIGVLAHVCESWKADREKTTAITSADERPIVHRFQYKQRLEKQFSLIKRSGGHNGLEWYTLQTMV